MVIAKTANTSANRARNSSETLSGSVEDSKEACRLLIFSKNGLKNLRGFGTAVMEDVEVRSSLTMTSRALLRRGMVTLSSFSSFRTVETQVSNRSLSSRSSGLKLAFSSTSSFFVLFDLALLSPFFSDSAVTETAFSSLSFGAIASLAPYSHLDCLVRACVSGQLETKALFWEAELSSWCFVAPRTGRCGILDPVDSPFSIGRECCRKPCCAVATCLPAPNLSRRPISPFVHRTEH